MNEKNKPAGTAGTATGTTAGQAAKPSGGESRTAAAASGAAVGQAVKPFGGGTGSAVTVVRILRYIRPHMPKVMVSLALALICVALTLYVPILVGRAVDCIIGPGTVNLEKSNKAHEQLQYLQVQIHETGS